MHTKAESRNQHTLATSSGQKALSLSLEVSTQAAAGHRKQVYLRSLTPRTAMEMFMLSWTLGSIPSYLIFSGLPLFPRGGTQTLRDPMICSIDAPRG